MSQQRLSSENVPRGTLSTLEKNREHLLELLFEFQEVKQPWRHIGDGEYHGMSDPELWHRSGLSWDSFELARDSLLQEGKPFIRDYTGALGLTW